MNGYSYPAFGGGVSRGLVTNGLTGGAPVPINIIPLVCFKGFLRLGVDADGVALLSPLVSGALLLSATVTGAVSQLVVSGKVRLLPTVTGAIVGRCC